jgi:hypothetical protein
MAVSLQKPGFAKVSGATKKVLDRLKAAEDNRIQLCDHSTPEEVRALRASLPATLSAKGSNLTYYGPRPT